MDYPAALWCHQCLRLFLPFLSTIPSIWNLALCLLPHGPKMTVTSPGKAPRFEGKWGARQVGKMPQMKLVKSVSFSKAQKPHPGSSYMFWPWLSYMVTLISKENSEVNILKTHLANTIFGILLVIWEWVPEYANSGSCHNLLNSLSVCLFPFICTDMPGHHYFSERASYLVFPHSFLTTLPTTTSHNLFSTL